MVSMEPYKQTGRGVVKPSTPEVYPGSSSEPAFGRADLSNCERELIHLAGSIQPHGTLFVVRESDGLIVQAAANARDVLRLDHDPLGDRLDRINGNLAERLGLILVGGQLDEIPVAIQCSVGRPLLDFDGLVHRLTGGGLVIELEPAVPFPSNLTKSIEDGLQTVVTATSLRTLCDDAARLFRNLTGYDRVMAYRFDDEGHGEVIAEQRRLDLESFLGNHYPASDIPQIARRLYEKNRVRVLVDVDYDPVSIFPQVSPLTKQDLDMSLCWLRSMSPIHIQYLKNMGVSATLVLSLVVGGRLWGLIACHHYQPRNVSYHVRALCEILAEAMATRIAALESFVQSQAELSVRRIEQRLADAISREGDWRASLFENVQALLQPVNASGVALLYDGQILTSGEVPGTAQLRDLAVWLDTRPHAPVISTASLGIDEPQFGPLATVASGVVAAPLSNLPGEYLIWIRPERICMVTWGGNPDKPAEVGENPSDLSPRRSFQKWYQQVEGTAEPWTVADLTAARAISAMIADVLLQFRSVRMLIAQDQLAQATRQAERSDQPLIITDHKGEILLANEAVQQLLPALLEERSSIYELFGMVVEPTSAIDKLATLLPDCVSWRGEITVRLDSGECKPLQLRIDPVVSAQERALGFVFMLSDLTERKAAEAARDRLQEGITERYRAMIRRHDSPADLAYRDLLDKVVGNSQLAALEITDGVDVDRMSEALECVRTSMARSTELLEHIIGHANAAHRSRRKT
jgi:light-regulated signal transduction histidine kinase (bacteriophytochrome)